jgi:hypothetical protein
MFETRGIVTTHWAALDGTHVTLNEPWAEAVVTNVDAPMMVLRSAATATRDEILCHRMRASYGATETSSVVLLRRSRRAGPGGKTPRLFETT